MGDWNKEVERSYNQIRVTKVNVHIPGDETLEFKDVLLKKKRFKIVK